MELANLTDETFVDTFRTFFSYLNTPFAIALINASHFFPSVTVNLRSESKGKENIK